MFDLVKGRNSTCIIWSSGYPSNEIVISGRLLTIPSFVLNMKSFKLVGPWK